MSSKKLDKLDRMWEIINDAIDKAVLCNESMKSVNESGVYIYYTRIADNKVYRFNFRSDPHLFLMMSESTLQQVIVDVISHMRANARED